MFSCTCPYLFLTFALKDDLEINSAVLIDIHRNFFSFFGNFGGSDFSRTKRDCDYESMIIPMVQREREREPTKLDFKKLKIIF